MFQHAQNHLECEGMGTTIVAVILTELFSTIAHIGDSRCYILNESGFSQITEDHSLVNELVRTGQISKEDAENHPRKNVLTRALGTEVFVDMDIKTIVFEEGDFLLLCSDGLSNKVHEHEMASTLKSEKAPLRIKPLHLLILQMSMVVKIILPSLLLNIIKILYLVMHNDDWEKNKRSL